MMMKWSEKQCTQCFIGALVTYIPYAALLRRDIINLYRLLSDGHIKAAFPITVKITALMHDQSHLSGGSRFFRQNHVKSRPWIEVSLGLEIDPAGGFIAYVEFYKLDPVSLPHRMHDLPDAYFNRERLAGLDRCRRGYDGGMRLLKRRLIQGVLGSVDVFKETMICLHREIFFDGKGLCCNPRRNRPDCSTFQKALLSIFPPLLLRDRAVKYPAPQNSLGCRYLYFFYHRTGHLSSQPEKEFEL